jgi:cytoskeletal protein CcmA (bactofilin family)
MFMFKRRHGAIPDIETLIGAGARIEGDLIVSGGVHLEGHVRGNVRAGPGAPAVLSIAQQGVVEGSVEVPRVVVHGAVRGDIRASGKVELGATARVSGSVSYGIIEMAAGAVIEGRLISPAPTPVPAPVPAEATAAADAEAGASVGPGAAAPSRAQGRL